MGISCEAKDNNTIYFMENKNKLQSLLDNLYKIMSEAYKGNWQYRWSDTPYLEKTVKAGKTESVVGHVWGTMEFWFNLRRLCPELDALVDTTEVYEIILNHDLGETHVGDMSLYRKIHGDKEDKKSERYAVEQISKSNSDTQKELLNWFDEFEKEIEKIDRLEVLIAKLVDNLQGDHYAISYGHDLSSYSEPINKILQLRFVINTNRLIEVLEEREESGAAEEIKQVAKHHAEAIKNAGIDLDISKLRI
jgi:5'-deoxynucleotidase YfbR-like HD superfamily hydrolase